MTIARAALLPALLAAAACGGEGRALERAVRDYDAALVRAYATSDPTLVEGLAGRKEADRIRILVDLKTANGIALESTLEALEVTSARADGDAGTVETSERWRYRDRPLRPGGSAGPEIRSTMRMRYALAREGGRWKVIQVATLSAETAAPPAPR